MSHSFKIVFLLIVLPMLLLVQPIVAQSSVPDRNPNEQGAFDGVLASCLQFVAVSQTDSDLTSLTSAQRDLFNRCSEMLSERNAGRQLGALDGMAREEVGVVGSTMTETTRVQLVNIQRRITTLRAMAVAQANSGASNMALASADVAPISRHNLSGHSYSSRSFSKPAAGGGQGSGSGGQGSRFGWFVNGEYSTGTRDKTILEDGFDYDGYDITVGIDRSFGSSSFFGGAAGFKSAKADLANEASDLEVDGYSLSLYGGSGGSGGFFDYTLGYAQNNFKSSTAIDYDITALSGGGLNSINQFALGDTDGTELLASLTFGYSYGSGSFNFQPYLNGTYTDTSIDGYTEQMIGAGDGIGLSLNIGDQDITSFTGALGATLSWNISTGFGVLVPTIRAEWEKEFDDDSRIINTQLSNAFDPTAANTILPIFTDAPDDEYYNVTAGLNFVFVGGTQFYMLYHSILDLDNVDFNGGTIGLRFEI